MFYVCKDENGYYMTTLMHRTVDVISCTRDFEQAKNMLKMCAGEEVALELPPDEDPTKEWVYEEDNPDWFLGGE